MPLSSSPAAPQGLIRGQDGRLRCFWAGHDALYQHYHDTEWGRPTHDDRYLFEKLCLEGFQAGLSWLTILRKRENFRAAFDNFDFRALAARADKEQRIELLLQNSGIIRHKGKISAVFTNARAAVECVAEYGSLSAYLRQFAPPKQARERPAELSDYQAVTQTKLSAALAKDLKRRGFRFIGPVSAYAYMQGIGIVNDHIRGCFCCAAAEAPA